MAAVNMRELFEGVIPFVCVAQEKSFKGAGERLGVTSAAISKSIKRLEERLGVRLLHRTTRRVSLSAEGELYLVRCQAAIEQMRAGEQALAIAQEEVKGTLCVSMSLVWAGFMTSRLPEFVKQYPGVKLRLDFSDRFSGLIDEGIDVAIRIGDLEDSTLVARRLARMEWLVVASRLYLEQRGTPSHPKELEGHACLRFRTPRGTLQPWNFLSPNGQEPESWRVPVTLETNLGDSLVDGAVSGLGLAQVFGFLVTDALRTGRLVEVLGDYAPQGPWVHALCLPGQTRNPRVRAFLDFLVEAFAGSRDRRLS